MKVERRGESSAHNETTRAQSVLQNSQTADSRSVGEVTAPGTPHSGVIINNHDNYSIILSARRARGEQGREGREGAGWGLRVVSPVELHRQQGLGQGLGRVTRWVGGQGLDKG